MKIITKSIVAILILSSLTSGVYAAVISDCTYSRYAYMDGSVAAAGKNYMLVGDMDASSGWGYSWLKFEIPDTTVSSAYLNLQSITQSAGMWSVPESSPVIISIYSVNAEVTAISSSYTASEFKSYIGEAIASITVSGGDAIYSWNITDIVNSWVTSGNNYGLVVSINSADDSTVYAKFGGVGATSGVPVITDVAMGIPEPATMILLTAGVLMSSRKRFVK